MKTFIEACRAYKEFGCFNFETVNNYLNNKISGHWMSEETYNLIISRLKGD